MAPLGDFIEPVDSTYDNILYESALYNSCQLMDS